MFVNVVSNLLRSRVSLLNILVGQVEEKLHGVVSESLLVSGVIRAVSTKLRHKLTVCLVPQHNPRNQNIFQAILTIRLSRPL